MKETNEIRVCKGHQDKEVVPLIWTFAFNGYEYWCPVCGYKCGMLGAGERVEETKELFETLKKYKKLSKKFLRANSLLVCSSFTYKGEQKKFNEMSKWFQTYWKNRALEWEYKY